jgi:hypothetical protein
MQTVTFVREYRHPLPDHSEARYPPGEFEVSDEVAKAAKRANALAPQTTEKTNGRRSAAGK